MEELSFLGLGRKAKGKVFRHVEQHFAPLYSMVKCLKAEKAHLSVSRPEPERKFLLLRSWKCNWKRLHQKEMDKLKLVSSEQIEMFLLERSWNSTHLTFKVFISLQYISNWAREQDRKVFLHIFWFFPFSFKSATWLKLQSLYLQEYDAGTGHWKSCQVGRCASFEWSGP